MFLTANFDSSGENTAQVIPVVNFNKCEAKGICTHVCFQNVFKINKMSSEQFGELSFVGKLKALFSDNRKSFVVNPGLCLNCGLCVTACPDKAIQLIRID